MEPYDYDIDIEDRVPTKSTYLVETLVDVCLTIIANHFEEFYVASQSPCWKEPMNFLARTYPEEIFHKLMAARQLKPAYLDVLINSHFRKLNVLRIPYDPGLLRDLVGYLKSRENNILSLNTSIRDEESFRLYKDLFQALPNLENVKVYEVAYQLTWTFKLENIARKCKRLRTLKMPESMNFLGWINWQDVLFVLLECPLLEGVYGGDVVQALFEKYKTDLKKGSLEQHKKYALTYMATHVSRYESPNDAFHICTVLCPHISGMKLSHLEDSETLRLCCNFTRLKHVGFNWESNLSPSPNDGMNHFLKLRGIQLITFCMSGGYLSAQSLVECCPNLQSLMLGKVTYQACSDKRGLSSESKLRNLKILKFEMVDCSNDVTAEALKLFLSVAPNVQELSLLHCEKLTDDFVSSILELGLYSIPKMKMDESDITVSPILELLLHGRLQELSVKRCVNVSKSDYLCILNHNQNRKVHITWSKYTPGWFGRYYENEYYESERIHCSPDESDDDL